MHQTGSIESAIRLEFTEVGICTLEELTERLPYYSWNHVFAVVERLSRKGTVTLQRSDSLGHILSHAPCRFARTMSIPETGYVKQV